MTYLFFLLFTKEYFDPVSGNYVYYELLCKFTREGQSYEGSVTEPETNRLA